jgi:hypothetical protein
MKDPRLLLGVAALLAANVTVLALKEPAPAAPEIGLLAVPIGDGEDRQQEAAEENTRRLQAALEKGGYVRVAPRGESEFPVLGLTVRRRGTWLDLRGVTLYLPKSSASESRTLLTVSGCSTTIEGGTLFAQELSRATGPLLSLRRDGRATDPGVWVRGTHVWGWTSGALVEAVGSELVTFDGVHLSQNGSGVCARLLVDGSSTRLSFEGGSYLSNYGGGDVAEVQGDWQEVSFQNVYMAGLRRGVVTVRRSAASEGEVAGLFMSNVRFEGPGPVVDASGTWLAESRFEGVSLGPGPGQPVLPVIRMRPGARNVAVGPDCRHLAGGPVRGEVEAE